MMSILPNIPTALIAARAAVETLNIDAAIVSEDMVWQEWQKGELTQQDILNAFRVERQPAASPGCTSLYLIRMKEEDLIHAGSVLKDFVYWGPSGINPKALYTIAIQKPQAFNQIEIFGKKISDSQPKPLAELWETIVTFARNRKSAGLSLDQGLEEKDGSNLAAMQYREPETYRGLP